MGRGVTWWNTDNVKLVRRATSSRVVASREAAKILAANVGKPFQLRIPRRRMPVLNRLYPAARRLGFTMHQTVDDRFAYIWWAKNGTRTRSKKGK